MSTPFASRCFVECPPHCALAGGAQHRTGQRTGAVAMGGRTDLRLAESVPATARALEKRADIHRAFLSLGNALTCWRFLRVDWAVG
jgi:hypothetical protein